MQEFDMWKYRVKPTLRISSLVHDGKTFRADSWYESVERLKGEWYKAYLIEKEIKSVKQELVIDDTPAETTPTTTTTKRKSS